MVEYLDPEIANEGFSVDKHNPGAWMDAPDVAGEEWQPDIEPPHVNDYAAFKKHKHYRQYFRAYRYIPFPAVMYHPTLGEKLVKSKEEVIALGPRWSKEPIKPRVDMTGKSLPVKSETQRLAETVASALAAKQGGGAVDAGTISAIVAAVMAAMKPAVEADAATPESGNEGAKIGAQLRVRIPNDYSVTDGPGLSLQSQADEAVERDALLELAEKEGIKVDGRWSSARIKKELGLG